MRYDKNEIKNIVKLIKLLKMKIFINNGKAINSAIIAQVTKARLRTEYEKKKKKKDVISDRTKTGNEPKIVILKETKT